MVEGFWIHPDFTLDMAHASFNWALQWQTSKYHFAFIEQVASDLYINCHLRAVWWRDVSMLQANVPNMPFAIPGSFTDFHFRSYQAVDSHYLVTRVENSQPRESSLPCGTIVYVKF